MKAYTDIEQSKKLSEILPLKSADMSYHASYSGNGVISGYQATLCPFTLVSWIAVPCWSLAALFNLFDWPKLSTSSMGDGSIRVMISAYPNGYRHDSGWHDNPVDACVELICKLKENNKS